jgi:hypothetical protein
MRPLDIDVLLDLVGELERELDRYLTEFPTSSEIIPHVVNTCRGIRADLESARPEEAAGTRRRAIH